MDNNILFEDTVRPGATWSHVLKRGTALRITDIDGGANVGAMFYNWENPVERYNMPDTLKAQHIAHLTRGYVLYSDMGRILCSVTRRYRRLARSVEWLLECRAGERKVRRESRYQEHRNDCHRMHTTAL